MSEKPIYLGSTPRIRITWRDIDGSLMTPTSQEWKIYDPAGELKYTETNPTEESAGVYYIDYPIDTEEKAGIWKVIFVATLLFDLVTRNGVSKLTFEVEET